MKNTEQRQRSGDDDVARHREGVGDQADHVQRQDEHEQREHEAGRTSCPPLPAVLRIVLATNS